MLDAPASLIKGRSFLPTRLRPFAVPRTDAAGVVLCTLRSRACQTCTEETQYSAIWASPFRSTRPIGPELCDFLTGFCFLRPPIDPTIVPFRSVPELHFAASFSGRPGRCAKRLGCFYPPRLSVSVLSITLIIVARMTSTARATISLCMRFAKRTVSRRISSSA